VLSKSLVYRPRSGWLVSNSGKSFMRVEFFPKLSLKIS